MTARTLMASMALLAVTTLGSTATQAWWGPGYGYNDWGPMNAFWDGDIDFNVNFRGSGFGRGHGYGRGYGYGPGYGYGYGYGYGPGYGYRYGYPYYPPVAYTVPAPAPVAAVVAQPAVVDADDDSILDTQDLCPDTPAGTRVDFTGCAEAQPITLRGVNFKLDSDELTPESSSILDRVAGTLGSHPEVTVEVGGHTDSQGDAAYNLDLSTRRASTVRDYLIAHGVPEASLTSAGYGETRLIHTADTAGAHAINRRVELTRTDSSATEVTPR